MSQELPNKLLFELPGCSDIVVFDFISNNLSLHFVLDDMLTT